MTHLNLILSQPPETPLRDVVDMFDFWELHDELAASGAHIEWEAMFDWQTCADVASVIDERKAA